MRSQLDSLLGADLRAAFHHHTCQNLIGKFTLRSSGMLLNEEYELVALRRVNLAYESKTGLHPLLIVLLASQCSDKDGKENFTNAPKTHF